MKTIKILSLITVLSVIAYSFTTISKQDSGNMVGTKVYNKAPELKYKNPEGKEIALSSLKGKIVLIDFWASWCGPCRRENPNVVAAYNKYKNAKFKNANGFEVYSVSLDQTKDKWVEAIKADGLIWPSHVSDLKYWASEGAAKYGVTSIPATFLIDEKGIIIATKETLHGGGLEAQLEKLMK